MSFRPLSWCRAALLAMPATGLAAPDASSAAVLEVTDCGDSAAPGAPGQLRRLINDAAGGDTVLVPACTIALTAGALVFSFASKHLTIQGAGAEATVLDGGGSDRVITITNPFESLTLVDLTVRNGRAATGGGGAIFANVLRLRRVVVRDSQAGAPPFNEGGGIRVSVDLVLEQSTVRDNATSGAGGGVFSASGLSVIDSTISGNTAARGGGIAYAGGLLGFQVSQSTVSGNQATGPDGGGGIHISAVTTPASILHSTVAGNGAENAAGGGITVGPAVPAGGVALRGTIVAGNSPANCDGTLTSAGYNLTSGTGCGLGQPTDLPNADPLLGPLGPNGGPTETRALLPGSPALDAGGLVGCPTADQRGAARPQDGNGDGAAQCDIGAYERRAPVAPAGGK